MTFHKGHFSQGTVFDILQNHPYCWDIEVALQLEEIGVVCCIQDPSGGHAHLDALCGVIDINTPSWFCTGTVRSCSASFNGVDEGCDMAVVFPSVCMR